MYCLLCHEKIPRLRAWRTKSEFCRDEHAAAYKEQTLERLLADSEAARHESARDLAAFAPSQNNTEALTWEQEQDHWAREADEWGREPELDLEAADEDEGAETEPSRSWADVFDQFDAPQDTPAAPFNSRIEPPFHDPSPRTLDWEVDRFDHARTAGESWASRGSQAQTPEEALEALRRLAAGASGRSEPPVRREAAEAAEPELPVDREPLPLDDDFALFSSFAQPELPALDMDPLDELRSALDADAPASIDSWSAIAARCKAEPAAEASTPVSDLLSGFDAAPSPRAAVNEQIAPFPAPRREAAEAPQAAPAAAQEERGDDAASKAPAAAIPAVVDAPAPSAPQCRTGGTQRFRPAMGMAALEPSLAGTGGEDAAVNWRQAMQVPPARPQSVAGLCLPAATLEPIWGERTFHPQLRPIGLTLEPHGSGRRGQEKTAPRTAAPCGPRKLAAPALESLAGGETTSLELPLVAAFVELTPEWLEPAAGPAHSPVVGVKVQPCAPRGLLREAPAADSDEREEDSTLDGEGNGTLLGAR